MIRVWFILVEIHVNVMKLASSNTILRAGAGRKDDKGVHFAALSQKPPRFQTQKELFIDKHIVVLVITIDK